VRRSLLTLRPEQRDLLTDVAAEELGVRPLPSVASDALRMARARARRQLRAALEVASAAVVFAWAGLRAPARLARRTQVLGWAPLVAATAAVMLVVPLTWPTTSGQSTSPFASDLESLAGANGSAAASGSHPAAVVRQERAIGTTGRPVPRIPKNYTITSRGPARVKGHAGVSVRGSWVVLVGDYGNGKPACVVATVPADPASLTCSPDSVPDGH
jgi:hypothetical protein